MIYIQTVTEMDGSQVVAQDLLDIFPKAVILNEESEEPKFEETDIYIWIGLRNPTRTAKNIRTSIKSCWQFYISQGYNPVEVETVSPKLFAIEVPLYFNTLDARDALVNLIREKVGEGLEGQIKSI